METSTNCQVCLAGQLSQEPFGIIEDVVYSQCEQCKSIYVADEKLLQPQKRRIYDKSYWENEAVSSRQRSFGSTLARIAEVFLYSRIPIDNFIDIGCGPGLTLDAISQLMPSHCDMFYGVELFPPPPEFRCSSNNYIIGSLGSCNQKFSAGICIEVIEHMFPWELRCLAQEIAGTSKENALYYFNSAQPDHVIRDDPRYLDPYYRGHVASYSLEGLSALFGDYGMRLIPLHGRNWAFLIEVTSDTAKLAASELLGRLWKGIPENIEKLQNNGFGPLMYTIGIESARCYLESAISEERAIWALSLEEQLRISANTQK